MTSISIIKHCFKIKKNTHDKNRETIPTVVRKEWHFIFAYGCTINELNKITAGLSNTDHLQPNPLTLVLAKQPH